MNRKKKNVKKPKEEVINIRCTTEQKTMLETIASHEGLGLSTWLLHVGILAAEERKTRRA